MTYTSIQIKQAKSLIKYYKSIMDFDDQAKQQYREWKKHLKNFNYKLIERGYIWKSNL